MANQDRFSQLIELLSALQTGDWYLYDCEASRPNLQVIDGEGGERVFHPATETVVNAVFRMRAKNDG
jgi:hypothetical protein